MLLLAGLVLGASAPAAVAQPTILLLHGGGWQSGSAASMGDWKADFEAHGYRTVGVDYPLGRVMPSIQYSLAIARQERQHGGPVIAYGVSAGGTIAAWLAATGAVDGAVNVIGPTDFTTWTTGIAIMILARMTQAEKREASPYLRLNGHPAPQLVQCGQLDVLTTYDQCVRYVRRAVTQNPDTTLQSITSLHNQRPVDRARGRAWVQARWPASCTTSRRAARPGAAPRRRPSPRSRCPRR